MKKYFMALGLCALSVVSCAATPAADTLVLKQGQTQFQFKLKSNPTTGYRWYFEKCSHGIKPVSAQYKANQSKLVGAPGMETWIFKVNASRLTVPRLMKCTLAYMRPWDPTTATKKTLWIVSAT